MEEKKLVDVAEKTATDLTTLEEWAVHRHVHAAIVALIRVRAPGLSERATIETFDAAHKTALTGRI